MSRNIGIWALIGFIVACCWPEGDPDYSPTARHDKPDECPNTNVPAHGRCPLLKLYPVLKVVHKPSAAGHPSADGRLSSSTRVIRPTANIGPTTHRSCVRRTVSEPRQTAVTATSFLESPRAVSETLRRDAAEARSECRRPERFRYSDLK